MKPRNEMMPGVGGGYGYSAALSGREIAPSDASVAWFNALREWRTRERLAGRGWSLAAALRAVPQPDAPPPKEERR